MKTLVIACVRFYQRFISRALHILGGPMNGCRFSPSCSQYFIEAVEIHGFLKGSTLGIWRILRCNPWGGSGFDPVPSRRNFPGGESSGPGTETDTSEQDHFHS